MSVRLQIMITFLVLLIVALLLNEWISVVFIFCVGLLTLSIVTYGSAQLRNRLRKWLLGGFK